MNRVGRLSILLLACAAASATSAYQVSNSLPGRIAGSGVIEGRVLDPGGRPIKDVLVVPLREIPSRRGPHVRPVSVRLGSVTTAAGEFRLAKLQPGTYSLVALPRNVPRNQRLVVSRDSYRFGYAITYYPGAARLSDAKTVTVMGNATVKSDITLALANLADISGTVFGSNGRPAAGSLTVLHGDNLFGVDSIAVPIRADGRFVVTGLPPGTYFLQYREGAWPPPRDVIPRVSGANVFISGADVTGVRVVPIEMAKVRGRLVLDANQRGLQSSTITVSGAPANSDGNPGPQRAGVVRPDLTFEFQTWPGPGYIRVFVGRQEWTTRRVRLNGADVSQQDITFESGHEMSGLDIELDKPLTSKRQLVIRD